MENDGRTQDNTYETIMCIVNAGFAGKVMDSARAAGAGGGTIIHAKGTVSKEAAEKYGIFVQPDKDVVMLVVGRGARDSVLKALYNDVGLDTEGGGIAFSLPVRRAVGLGNTAANSKAIARGDAPEK